LHSNKIIDRDVPLAIFYSITHDRSKGSPQEFEVEDAVQHGRVKSEASVGVPMRSDGIPVANDLLFADKPFLSAFEKVVQVGKPSFIDLEPRPDLVHVLSEEGGKRGHGDKPRAALLCPIEPTTHKNLSGVLLLGLNPRRPYNDDYKLWVNTLSRTISSSLASVLLVGEQKRMVQLAAERTEEAVEMEQRALAMIENSSVGSFLMTPEGQMLYVNQAWKDIAGYSKQVFELPEDWIGLIAPEDLEMMTQTWRELVESEQEVAFNIRWKKPWSATEPGPTVTMCGAAIREICGKKLVTGSITDISRQVWAEAEQKRMKEEALERKRQQETFIDMTSHEMRNPLSAVFQCADAIVSTLTAYRISRVKISSSRDSITSEHSTGSHPEDAVSAAIGFAETINICASHQKRIVDDVLVLSKLNAGLVEITPVNVQPKTLVQDTMKMFGAEMAAHNAHMAIKFEDSFEQDLNVDWAMLDPVRVRQILINLCTNAIKFTVESETRQVTITVGASVEKPVRSSLGIEYLHTVAGTESKIVDPTVGDEWGNGQALYLTFQVSDTGKGMTAEEVKLLFKRFQQASPRTHTQYGGSGLGLYIARLLTQLQGGEIGVISAPQVGTTFAFYIKVRRAEHPDSGHLHPPNSVPEINVQTVADSIAEPGHPLPPSQPAMDPSDISILIVEDNLVNQRILRRQLESTGFTTYCVNNGREALNFMKRTKYWRSAVGDSDDPASESTPADSDAGDDSADGEELSLILMDVEMPVLSGTEATREIRRWEEQGRLAVHVPIMAITGNARQEQVDEVVAAGMVSFVALTFPSRFPV
jgi:PAS domain S-box-containing protein